MVEALKIRYPVRVHDLCAPIMWAGFMPTPPFDATLVIEVPEPDKQPTLICARLEFGDYKIPVTFDFDGEELSLKALHIYATAKATVITPTE